MPFEAWRFGGSWGDLGVAVVAAVGVYAAVILYTRIAGLRSFSQMSAFDFAMTVAVGSSISSVALGSVPLLVGVVAIGVLYASQVVIALARRNSAVDRLVDNQPLLLMREGHVVREHLAQARLSENDLVAKLREKGVGDPTTATVVFETTGNVSVLQGPFDPWLLQGVRQ